MVDGYRPKNLAEALQIRSKHATIPLAGGTDLMVQRARRTGLTPAFDKPPLFLNHLAELKRISRHQGQVRVGAGVTLNALLGSKIIPQILKTIVIRMASHPIRNLATIGGNICNASPAGDTLPYLYAVDAILILQSNGNTRQLSVTEFIAGPGKTDLQPDELLTEIVIPDKIYSLNYYRKAAPRKGMSLSKISFLGLADIESGSVKDVRIACGAVAPQVVRSRKIEKMLIGKKGSAVGSIRADILSKYAQLIQPIDDARSSKIYRYKVSLRIIDVFLKNFLCA